MMLSAWNATDVSQDLLEKLKKWTDPSSSSFIPDERRYAAFDLDGTIWCEKPHNTEVTFIESYFSNLLNDHQHQRHHSRIFAALENVKNDIELGFHDLFQLFNVLFSHVSENEYQAKAREFVLEHLHPRFNVPYQNLVFEPVREVLNTLKDNGFKAFIASGSSSLFLHAWVGEVLGIPNERVFGSSVHLSHLFHPVILNVGKEKVRQLRKHMPVPPAIVFGNTGGDVAMLEWANSGSIKPFTAVIHHDDAEREYQYPLDHKLSKALLKKLDATHVVSMKSDWTSVFSMNWQNTPPYALVKEASIV